MNESALSPPVGELLNLAGRTILVTGASGNIGRGIATRLAAAGAAIVVHYCNDEAGANKTAAGLPGGAANATVLQADLSSESAVNSLFESLQSRAIMIDGVVNNAAVQPVQAIADTTGDDWQAVIRANLDGAFLVSRAAAETMRAAGSAGGIVNIASIEGLDPAPGHAHYAASKAGMIMLTRSLALEYGAHGIRANTVSPGLIDRDTLSRDWPEGVGRWQQTAPLQRMGQPEDVADAVLFLLSPAARWISGSNLVVDGGMSSVSRW